MARTSKVDASKPSSPIAYTRDVRKNFQAIKDELEEIFAILAGGDGTQNPKFSGLMEAESAILSNYLTVQGLFTPTTEVPVLVYEPTLVSPAQLGVVANWNAAAKLTFTKMASGFIFLSGLVSFQPTGWNINQAIIAVGGVPVGMRPTLNSQPFLMPAWGGGAGGYFGFRLWVDGSATLDVGNHAAPYTTGLELVNFNGVYKPT